MLYFKVYIEAYGKTIFFSIIPDGRLTLTNPKVKREKSPILINYEI